MQLPLRDIEGIGAEEPIDFFFELHKLGRIEGILEDFCRENGQGLEEVNVRALVRLNLRFELDE